MVGGIPLAFTQDNFLVFAEFILSDVNSGLNVKFDLTVQKSIMLSLFFSHSILQRFT